MEAKIKTKKPRRLPSNPKTSLNQKLTPQKIPCRISEISKPRNVMHYILKNIGMLRMQELFFFGGGGGGNGGSNGILCFVEKRN